MIDPSYLTESHEAPRAKRTPESGRRFYTWDNSIHVGSSRR